MACMSNRIHELRVRAGLSLDALADRAGTTRQQIHKLEKGERKLTWDWMRRLGAALNVEPSQIATDVTIEGPSVGTVQGRVNPGQVAVSKDVDPTTIVTDGLVGNRDLPVYASAMGGSGEMIVSYEPIEYVKRPSILEGVPGGFAMYVVGDSMEPRYEPGELLLVHPKKTALPGDDVLVVTVNGNDDDNEAMVKRLVRFSGSTYRLKQHNPKGEFDLPADKVKNCFVIVGSYGRRR